MNKTVFLDRDGVINEEVNYLSKVKVNILHTQSNFFNFQLFFAIYERSEVKFITKICKFYCFAGDVRNVC